MRHRYTRQELESITHETPIYLEGAGIAQLQWGGWEIAEGVRDGYLYCKHIKPFALELYDKYWTAWDGPPEKDYKQATNADRIRAMSNEKLASEMKHRSISTICDIVCQGDCKAIATLNKTCGEVCKEIIMKWLQQPAEEDT